MQVLSRLEVAFSREGAKEYVQDRLKANATSLRPLLAEQGGYVFVCGDGGKMVKDVEAVLGDMLGGPRVLESLAAEGRYLKDVWSS